MSLKVINRALIYLYIFMIGFGPILNYFFPINILGKSMFMTFVPFLVLFIIYFTNFNILNDKLFLSLNFFLLFVASIRALIFSESFFLLLTANLHFYYVIFLLNIFTNMGFKGDRYMSILLSLMLFFHLGNNVSHFLGFNSFNFEDQSNEDFVENSRFAGMMGGANVNAHFIVIMVFISVNYIFKKWNFIKIGILVLGLIAVLTTLSKGGIIGYILVLVSLILGLFKSKQSIIYLLMSVCFIFIIKSYFQFWQIDAFYDLFTRFMVDDLSNGRSERISLYYELVKSDFTRILIGIPDSSVFVDKKLNISDNSLLLVLSKNGALVAIIYFIYIARYIRFDSKFPILSLIFLILFYLTILTNNAVLYFQWISIAILSYSILFFNSSSSTRCANNFQHIIKEKL